MGLSNQYVGETRRARPNPKIGSANYFHRYANKRRNLALSADEAEQLSEEFSNRQTPEMSNQQNSRLRRRVFELECVGRVLEPDEEEFITENQNYVVIDV